MEGIIPPPRRAAEKQARRRLAVPTVLDGWSQAEGADFLGLHPVTVAKWMARYRAGGEAGLDAKPAPGRPRFRSGHPEREVLSWRDRQPAEFGSLTDRWTVAVSPG
jgi:transposase